MKLSKRIDGWLVIAFMVATVVAGSRDDLVWVVANGFGLLYMQRERDKPE